MRFYVRFWLAVGNFALYGAITQNMSSQNIRALEPARRNASAERRSSFVLDIEELADRAQPIGIVSALLERRERVHERGEFVVDTIFLEVLVELLERGLVVLLQVGAVVHGAARIVGRRRVLDRELRVAVELGGL